ncbi:hypothetical protein IWW51_002957 [Coemansia sp. RSA 2702]|nr:hypothetical protein IWW51_002957 [Coemansia sp. RSA 2702]
MDMTNAGNDRRRPSPPLAAEEQRKRQRLNVSDGQSYARMESILREQLDLELYLKQKEVNTISEHLRHSEALLDVLESAIQSQQQATPTSSDAADGFLSYFHRLNELSQEAHEHWERPRRAAAAPARYTTDYYDMDAQSTDDDASAKRLLKRGRRRSTHKWTLYIRGAAADESIGGFIRKARVFLHPSYRPDDIVDLTPPMLELTRWGWGEFPVRVQIFFSDKRNKPVDLVHILKLDDSHAGEEVTGSETPVDLELDRRGFADDGRSVGSGTRAA